MGKGLNLAVIPWDTFMEDLGGILDTLYKMIDWEAVGAAISKVTANLTAFFAA